MGEYPFLTHKYPLLGWIFQFKGTLDPLSHGFGQELAFHFASFKPKIHEISCKMISYILGDVSYQSTRNFGHG